MASPETADVVLIGGGVIGASLAFYLARRRPGRIVVLEREALGSGSTGRSVASIDLLTLQPAAVALEARSYEAFANFKELTGDECGLVMTGFAMLGQTADVAGVRTAVDMMRAAGVESHLLSPRAFAGLEPGATVSDLSVVGYVPAGGYADPMLTTNGFANAARRMGVIIEQGRTVTGLRRTGGAVSGVETSAGFIAAPVVVCAAGPWTASLLRRWVLDDLGLKPVQHPVILLNCPSGDKKPHLSLLDLPNGVYSRPEGSGLAVAGSIDPETGYDLAEPEDAFGHPAPEYSFWTMERLVRRYPGLETAELRPGWSGPMTVSPDWQPLLGALPILSGLYCAAGFSGQGFKISPAVGDLMAGLILGEARAAEVLAPFRPARFAEDEPLTASVFGGPA
jgi:sarcosine oxidase subunit beta